MRLAPMTRAATAAALSVFLAVPGFSATAKKKCAAFANSSSALTPRERALHALDRLTFGPRPGDLARVEAMGVDKWIDLQLHPEKISDQALDDMLTQFPAMRLSESELIKKFPPAPMLRAMERNNAALPSDPVEHAIYANQVAYIKAQAKQQNANAKNYDSLAQRAKDASAEDVAKPTIAPETMTSEEEAEQQTQNTASLALPAEARFQALLAMSPGAPRNFMQHLKQPERLALVEGLTPLQREIVVALADCNRVVAGEEMEQKLLYDIYSERALQEVMTDFWLNHFNVYVRKSGMAPWQIADYERDVIRPRALGKFEDLLRAVATSPAMMDYLDNASSIGPNSFAAQGAARRAELGIGKAKAAGKPAAAGKRGLNENYARELMELQTLGVNGGYTQQDVTEVAKVFTGWTVEPPRDGGGFVYMERRHEPGDKQVLGKTIHENGQQEGFAVLHMLATSPATAKFISRKLAIRFVSDEPPQALIDAMAKTYLSSHGDISEVMRTLLRSPQFWSREAYRAKVKTPLEFVVSAVRATQSDAEHPRALISALNQMGMPLYGMQPPTGYSDLAEAWVNSAALLTRMNFGLALAANKLPGLECDLPASTGATPQATEADPAQAEARLEQVLLNGVVGGKTHQAVLAEMKKLPEQEAAARSFAQKSQADSENDPLDAGLAAKKKERPAARQVNLNVSLVGASESDIAAGLLLGSPEFQRK